MSRVTATISDIKSIDSLHLVKFDFNGSTLNMVSLELNESVKVGSVVKLSIKPFHIALSKDLCLNSSYLNQIQSVVVSISKGELLDSVKLECMIEAIITSSASKKMGLKEGDNVVALINESEISISEVLSD